jgi:hypothetical protein
LGSLIEFLIMIAYSFRGILAHPPPPLKQTVTANIKGGRRLAALIAPAGPYD